MSINEILPSLYLVDLDLPLPGFRRFISSWIYIKDKRAVVIDPGPTSTIPVLVQALKELEIKKIDYLLLTHIHLDHGGGAGALLEHFPETPVCCHPKAIAHLTNPEKLWQGSLKVLGDIARSYGAVKSVDESRLFFQEHIGNHIFDIEVIETPGHAAHQLNYLIDDLLFAAESAGVSFRVGSGFYQRIASPPRFIYHIYRSSLEKVAKIPAKQVCLGHYGARGDVQNFFETALAQLEFWMNVLEETMRGGDFYDENETLRRLLKTDPALRLFPKLDKDIQKRELYFCRNSLQGIYSFLSSDSN